MFPNENISAQTSDLDTDAVTLTGLSEDEVLELFGEPQSQRSNLWLYEDGLRVWFNDLGNAIAATRNGIDVGDELQLIEQAVVLSGQQEAVLNLGGAGPVVLDIRVVERALRPEECPTVEPCFSSGDPPGSRRGPHTLDVWQGGQLIYSSLNGGGLGFADDLLLDDITGNGKPNFFMDPDDGSRERSTCVYEIDRDHVDLTVDFVECVTAWPGDFVEIDASSRFPGLEVKTYDPGYICWPGSCAEQPAPPVILVFDEERYVLGWELMVRPIEDVWRTILEQFDDRHGGNRFEDIYGDATGYTEFVEAETIEDRWDAVIRMVTNDLTGDDWWPAYCGRDIVGPLSNSRVVSDMPFGNSFGAGSVFLFDATFELIYTGHWSAAWQLFEGVWPATAEWSVCKSLYRENFLWLLGISKYGPRIAVENGHVPLYYARAVQLSSLTRGDWYPVAGVKGRLPRANHWLPEDVDDPEAVRLLRLAAEEEDVAAQILLAHHYVNGMGAPQDFVLAHKWLNVAAAVVSDEDWCSGACRDMVVAERDRIDGLLTATQRAEAQRRAREWDEAHPRD